MEGYIKDSIDSGKIRTEHRPVQLTEDGLGSYEAQALAILIGRDQVIADCGAGDRFTATVCVPAPFRPGAGWNPQAFAPASAPGRPIA